MKKTTCLLLQILTFFISTLLIGQETFNKRMRFDFPVAVMTSVVPTDSFYFTTSIIADSLPPYMTGTAFAKFDLEGELLDIKTLTSAEKTYEAWFNNLISLPDGGFAVPAYSFDTTVSSLLLRYNSDGDTLFTRSYQNPNSPNFIFIQPRGGLVHCSDNGFLFCNAIKSSLGNTDNHLIKTDSLGIVEWEKTYPSSEWDRPESILATPDGGYIIGAIQTNDNTNVKDYIYQCHIFKVDSIGSVVWDYLSPLMSGLRDAANDMVLLDDGSIVVASGVGHEIERTSVNVVHFDKMVFKLSPNQEMAWERVFIEPYRNSSTETTKVIELSNSSGLVVAGVTDESEISPPVLGANTAWVTKISNEGDSIWTRHYIYFDDRPSEHIIYDMKELPEGGFIVCGESKDLTPGAIYRQQAFLMKLDRHGCLIPNCHLVDGVEEEPENVPKLLIFPNPVKDYLNFQLQNSSPIKSGLFRIVDMTGKIVNLFKTDVQPTDTYVTPTWGWAEGMYHLQFVDDENNMLISEKFYVSH